MVIAAVTAAAGADIIAVATNVTCLPPAEAIEGVALDRHAEQFHCQLCLHQVVQPCGTRQAMWAIREQRERGSGDTAIDVFDSSCPRPHPQSQMRLPDART